MIISAKKPTEEVMAMLEDATKIAIVGCGSCATSCKVGGEEEIAAWKEYLEANGKEVVATAYPGEACQKLLVKKEMKPVKAAKPDAVLVLSCGDGVQTVADNIDAPCYPGNNTMFLGQVERVGIFNEACRMCGDCVLGSTAGICPITKCAKSLVNGPCGGQKNGKCEVNPENDCAWIAIYNRMEKLGLVEKLLSNMNADKGYADLAYPRKINLKEGK